MSDLCPLCLSSNVTLYYEYLDPIIFERIYFRCVDCDLVFLKPDLRLSPLDEKKRYDCHCNSIHDEGYVDFLNRLLVPLKTKLQKGDRGLDFGCGPGPAVDQLMKRDGFSVCNYDLYYAKNESLFNLKYRFITCTEVVEHLYDPREELLKLSLMLDAEKGILAVMTQIFYDTIDFQKWWYPKDPTHVCFYSMKTFEWIANWLKLKLENPIENVVFLEK